MAFIIGLLIFGGYVALLIGAFAARLPLGILCFIRPAYAWAHLLMNYPQKAVPSTFMWLIALILYLVNGYVIDAR